MSQEINRLQDEVTITLTLNKDDAAALQAALAKGYHGIFDQCREWIAEQGEAEGGGANGTEVGEVAGIKKQGVCAMCGGAYYNYGNNPEPLLVYRKRVCNGCNGTVIHARLGYAVRVRTHDGKEINWTGKQHQ